MDKVKNIDEMPKKSPLSLQIDLKKFESYRGREEAAGCHERIRFLLP